MTAMTSLYFRINERGIQMIKQDKNRIMLLLSIGVVGLSILIHILHRSFHLFSDYLILNNINAIPDNLYLLLNLFLIVPILLGLVSVFIWLKGKTLKKYLPILNTLTLTFGSISIIAGGNGMVEYHFSIFMVIAIIAYYESINLILVSTAIFAIQHFVGYFVAPELLCGTHNYEFGLLMIHAIFLILASGATILQILAKNKYTMKLEKESEMQEKELNQILSNLMVTSKQVVNTSKILADDVDQTIIESNHITETMQQVAEGTQQQSVSTKESADAMNEMSIGIQRVAESANVISEHSQSAVQVAKEGEETVELAVEQMNFINKSVNQLSQMIMMLGKRTQRIDDIVHVITAISEQTNLLALNAAIEAARAGEHGKGFAVVANEVRNLAEQSQSSAKEITQLISEIHFDTNAAVEAMNVGIKDVGVGLGVVQKAGESFNNIVKASEVISVQIEEMSSVAEEMSASSQQVSASVEEVSQIADTTASNTKIAAHATEEQLKVIKGISDVSTTLNKLAEELQQLFIKFSHQE